MRGAIPTLAFVALAALGGCDAPSCGAGTKRVQASNGASVCVPADATSASIPCDVDGGAAIVGGVCVAEVTCGAGTALDPVSNECLPTAASDVPPCPTPTAGNLCVHGALYDFVDGSRATVKVHVAVFDPLDFLGGGAPLAQSDVSTGSFVFTNVRAPSLKLLAIAVGDKAGSGYVLTGVAAQNIVAGQSYRIDGYVLARAVVDGWSAQTGSDWYASGAYVARFFGERRANGDDWSIFEKTPIAGVQLMQDGAPASAARYFGATVTTIDPTATMTGASGGAILPAPGGTLSTFTGSGAGINWESFAGSSVANVFFVSRFHPL